VICSGYDSGTVRDCTGCRGTGKGHVHVGVQLMYRMHSWMCRKPRLIPQHTLWRHVTAHDRCCGPWGCGARAVMNMRLDKLIRMPHSPCVITMSVAAVMLQCIDSSVAAQAWHVVVGMPLIMAAVPCMASTYCCPTFWSEIPPP
jgi:hypothetical protein